jgi:chromosome segregation ATPase
MATPVPSEGTPTPTPGESETPPAPPATKSYSEEDLEKARQQEKAKLYAELEKLREQTRTLPEITSELEALRKEREDREAAAAAAKQEAEEKERAQQEAEMSAKDLLDKRNQEWEEKFAEIQRQREAERELLEKERTFSQLREYVQSRVQQERENIAPELLDLVDGNSPEEVDASIERLKAKSQAIAEKIRGTQQQLAAQQQGVSPSGFNTSGPEDMLPSTQQWSAEDIRNMSPKEFAEKVRPHFLGRSDTRNRGLFG